MRVQRVGMWRAKRVVYVCVITRGLALCAIFAHLCALNLGRGGRG